MRLDRGAGPCRIAALQRVIDGAVLIEQHFAGGALFEHGLAVVKDALLQQLIHRAHHVQHHDVMAGLDDGQFFCKEEDAAEWKQYWTDKRLDWYINLGLRKDFLRLRPHEPDELAHYAKSTTDIEYLYPWGWGELEGIADRGNYDLMAHQEKSGKDLTYFDSKDNTKHLPSVIEPAGGLTRTVFALLLSTYKEEQLENGETRTLFKMNFDVAPIQIAILPLSKKNELIIICNQINSLLSTQFRTEIDVTQSIGKRYRRQDEIGTPSCITVDFESLSDNCVTVRNRDTMEQERIEINSLVKYFKN